MIARDFSAERLNQIVNDPAVYPLVHGPISGELDMTVAVQNQLNVNLVGEHGGILFQHISPGMYEAHTNVLPFGRGKWAFDMACEAVHWMFTRTDAIEVLSMCPKGNIRAKALCRAVCNALGGRLDFMGVQRWLSDQGEEVPAEIWAIGMQDWIRMAPELLPMGTKFFAVLQEQLRQSGFASRFKMADVDVGIRRIAGLTLELLSGGQHGKAKLFWDRYAAFNNLPMLEISCYKPLTVQLGGFLLIIRPDGSFWVPRIEASAETLQ